MPRNDASDDLRWAVSSGAAITADQVDAARRGATDLADLADDVAAGAAASLPGEPSAWRSDASTAYSAELERARLALVSVSAILADAAGGLAATAWRLQEGLDEQNAALAAGAAS
jgi:hypothetical protein